MGVQKNRKFSSLLTQNKAESVEELTTQINELEEKYNLVDEVLRDVIKTIEFDV